MSFIGIEEIFLQVEDMQKALDFYQGVLGIPVDKQDAERTYLQTERGHVVLQIRNHTAAIAAEGRCTTRSRSPRRPSTRFSAGWRAVPGSLAAPTGNAARGGRCS